MTVQVSVLAKIVVLGRRAASVLRPEITSFLNIVAE